MHQANTGDMYAVITAILGSLISGVILILIHHLKVKQEIEKHRQIELFDRKQRVYRSLLRLASEYVDYSAILGKDLNWRINRDIYNEVILIGSNTVIDAFNKFLKEWDMVDDKKATELLQSMWIAVRKDLYGENLSPEQMKFHNPSKITIDGFTTYGKYRDKLRPLGIKNYESLADMNIDDIHSKTGIDKIELEVMKKSGLREVNIEKEWKNFIEKHNP